MAFQRIFPAFARDMEQVMAQMERNWYPITRSRGNGMYDWYWEPVVLRHPRTDAHLVKRRCATPVQSQVAAPVAAESAKSPNTQASKSSALASNSPSSAQPREDHSQQPSTVHLPPDPVQHPILNWLAPFVAPWAVTPGSPFAEPLSAFDTTAPRLAHATLTETDHAYQVDVDLPGIPKENVTLSWDEGNTLVVKGEIYATAKADDSSDTHVSNSEVEENQANTDKATTFTTTIEDEDASEHQAAEEPDASVGTVEVKSTAAPPTQQQVYRSFERSFTFPDHVDPERITARLDNGLLKITVPKRERVAKTIPITF
ncbi:hypothetical protein H4R34_000950 [Dimargaris verticillata]|uniref:SHSP domain-containing protein n=1 Tax=Dimargaris verticillata TaxID=2761393 RepID=A0A9W8EBE2_9FUNG|nr:hypothetical protein H4R34_000950 [Dimargaris verticillata]